MTNSGAAGGPSVETIKRWIGEVEYQRLPGMRMHPLTIAYLKANFTQQTSYLWPPPFSFGTPIYSDDAVPPGEWLPYEPSAAPEDL